jgi:hypothetical protein
MVIADSADQRTATVMASVEHAAQVFIVVCVGVGFVGTAVAEIERLAAM